MLKCFKTTRNVCRTPTIKRVLSTQMKQMNVLTHPGSRILSLSHPEEGNYLTDSLLKSLTTHVQKYSTNHTIGVVLFNSDSPEMFSNGLPPHAYTDSESRKSTLAAIDKFCVAVSESENETVAVFGGEVDAMAFSAFAQAKYRLGSPCTVFRLHELFKNRLPLGGGLAQTFAKGCTEGVEMARYLAISGRECTSSDLFSLGLLTHIVEDAPHVNLCNALSKTLPPDDGVKAVQPSAIDKESLKPLLDTMDAESPIDADRVKEINDDPMWGEMMMILPEDIDERAIFEEVHGKVPREIIPGETPPIALGEDIEDIADGVKYCFSVNTLEETKVRLIELLKGKKPDDYSLLWAEVCLKQLEVLSPTLVQKWYDVTAEAKKHEKNEIFREFEQKLLQTDDSV